MTFVLDASITACWALKDEYQPLAADALRRASADEAYVPSLRWFEIRNTLIVNERRGRIDPSASGAFLDDLRALRILQDHAPDEGAILELARGHDLTVHDAASLELARRKRMPLATLDGALPRAARRDGVELLEAP